MSTEIGIRITAKDEASAVLAAAGDNTQASMSKIESSANKASTAVKNTSGSTKDAIVGFSGLAVSAFAVYSAFDRYSDMSVAVDRANLNVKRSTETLDQAQKNLNEATGKYGANSAEAKDATDKLAIAQEALGVAEERAKMIQDNQNEALAQFGIMIIPTAITAMSSLNKLSESLPGTIKNLSTSIGSLDISTKTLAVSAAAAVGAFAIGYTVLNSIPEPMRQTAAVIAIVTGVLIAATVAAAAFYSVISLGVAIPVILAGVGAAVAGVTVALQGSTKAADEFGAEMSKAGSKAATSLADVSAAVKGLSDTETSNYQKTVDLWQKGWDQKIGKTKTALQEVESEITSYYQDELDLVQTSKDQEEQIINSHWDMEQTSLQTNFDNQLSIINQFYDDWQSTADSRLKEIREGRSKDLDALELGMLLQKEAVDNSGVSGDVRQQQLTAITQAYNAKRSQISDQYRIAELQAEQQQAIDTVTIEAKRQEDITKAAVDNKNNQVIIENQRITELTGVQTKYAADVVGIQTKMNDELQTARNQDVINFAAYQQRLLTIAEQGKLQLSQLMTFNPVPAAPGTQTVQGVWELQSTQTTQPQIIQVQNENLVFKAALNSHEITQAQYNEVMKIQNQKLHNLGVPGYARGIEGVTTGPMLALIGESGPERVSIQPVNKAVDHGGAVTVNAEIPVNITIGNLSGSASLQETLDGITKAVALGADRGLTHAISGVQAESYRRKQ